MRAFFRNWEPAGYWRPRRVAQAVEAGRGEVVTLAAAVKAGCDLLAPDLHAAASTVATVAEPHQWTALNVSRLPSIKPRLVIRSVVPPSRPYAERVACRLLDEPILWLAHNAEDDEIRSHGVTAAVRRGRLRDDAALALPKHTLAAMSDLAIFARYGADSEAALSQARDLAAGVRTLRRDDVRRLAHENAGGGRIEHLGSRRGNGGGRQSAAAGQAYAGAARQ